MAGDVRYVDQVPSKGNWLLVQIDGGSQLSLPYGLKVQFTGRKDNRDYFRIVEGAYKGTHASVSAKAQNQSYLITAIEHLQSGLIRFDSKSQHIYFGNRGPFNAFSGKGTVLKDGVVVRYTPVPPGTHLLAIPAYPSAQTRPQYGTWTRFHKTWFRIGLSDSGSRFLHTGEISDGCVTVRPFLYDGNPSTSVPQGFADLPRAAQTPNKGLIGLPLPPKPAPTISFDEIYRYLILRRLSDQAVGKMIVTNDGRL